MKNTTLQKIFALFFILTILSFTSCEDMMGDYLEKPPGGDVTEDTIFSSKVELDIFMASIYQMGIHSNLGYAANSTPPRYANEDENIFAGASDEAETCAEWYRMNWWNDGSIGPNRTDDSRFDYRFIAIRKITVLLDRISDVPDITPEYREQLKAEAKLIRALNYFEMMKRYGGMPIIRERLQMDGELKIPRSQLKEMVEFMLEDIDLSLPHLLPNTSGVLKGRITQGTALALKSKILLYAASPLFNTDSPYLNFGENNPLICLGESVNRKWWEDAAAAADACLRWAAANGCFLITGDVDNNYFNSWEKYDNPEIILAEKSNGGMGCWNRPWSGIIPYSIISSSSGTNGVTPLLNFVRKYEDRNGNKVDWSGGDDLQSKMANLDRRFAQTIAYNLSSWSAKVPQVELWQANPDLNKTAGAHLGSGSDYCSGGFWLHKLVSPSIMRPENQEPVPNSTLFQLNEIYLNFAEAMNEAYGPDDKQGYLLSAREAINVIRERSGQPKILSGSGIYSNFRELIRNERAIELAFDNHRFWDVRRWMIAEEDGVMRGDMQGVEIYWIAQSPAEFRYIPKFVETRTFTKKMYLHPFSVKEVNIGYLVQNPGY
jgi:hypothetical protein